MKNNLIELLLPYKQLCHSTLKPEQKICVEFANSLREMTLSGKLNYIWYHIPNEFLPSARKNFSFDLKQKHMGKISGVPDYCFMGKGDCFFIEFKVPNAKQSSSQKLFESWCIANKVDYFICNSSQEGLEIISSRKHT